MVAPHSREAASVLTKTLYLLVGAVLTAIALVVLAVFASIDKTYVAVFGLAVARSLLLALEAPSMLQSSGLRKGSRPRE